MGDISDMAGHDKRITMKRTRPNPLFHEWLQELREEAKLKKNKLEYRLDEAISSLSKYPLQLQTGSECLILKGFNSKLCTFLDKRLDRHKRLNKGNINSSSKVTKTKIPELLPINAIHIPKIKTQSQIPKDTLRITSGEEISKASKATSHKSCETIDLSQEGTPEAQQLQYKNKVTNIPQKVCEYEFCPTPLVIPHYPDSDKSQKAGQNKIDYKPIYRSGSYAIMMALWEHSNLNSIEAINKEDLLQLAHKHSEYSMRKATDETYHFIWTNMTDLMSKGLVSKKDGANVVYRLTKSGYATAQVLHEEYQTKQASNDATSKQSNTTTNSKPPQGEETKSASKNIPIDSRVYFDLPYKDDLVIEMDAGYYDIVLLIDINETIGLSKKNDPIMVQIKKYPKLKHEYRCLSVGDFTWIARHKTSKEELVLPYIIERKRMDDLAASIKDGRFHEQKFRLKKCCANVIYMVESYDDNKNVGLPVQTLMQGLVNTRVQDGFKVHFTDSLVGSVRFLAILTMRLIIEYQDSSLKGHNKMAEGDMLMTYEYFNKAFMKNKPLSVRYTFIKLLLQLKGLSVERALAITNKYKTPKLLMDAYEECDQKEGENLLANIKCENNRNVGPYVSKSVYQLFTTRDLK